jgi:capsular exopolysaccharide synthesis family protein
VSNENHELPVSLQKRTVEPASAAPDWSYRFPFEPWEESEAQSVWDYLRILWRRKGFIAALSILGALIGASTILPQTPTFRARTALEIQRRDNIGLRIAATGEASDVYLQTQVKILTSETLLNQVIQDIKDKGPGDVTEQLSALQNVLDTLGYPVTKPVLPIDPVLRLTALSVRINTPQGTRIIEIFCDAPDPKLAADFANTLVSRFSQRSLESRWNNAQETTAFLNKQLDDLQTKIGASESRLRAYAKESDLNLTPESKTVSEEKLRQLQHELSNAQVERVTKQSRYELAASQPIESVPELYNSGPLATYRTRLIELQREHAELSAAFTPQHYRVQRVQAQIDVLEAAIKTEGDNILARLRNDYEAAGRREKLLEEAYGTQAETVARLSEGASQYEVLKREVDADRQLYTTLLQQVKEIGITSTMDASNVSVIDPATARTRPYRPDLPQATALGFLTGMVLSLAFVIARERADTRLKHPGKTLESLRMPDLGAIPAARMALGKRAFKRLKANKNGSAVELATWQNKDSFLAESFRAVVASILFSHSNGHVPKVIVVSSPHPNEGKTMTVTNLGIAIAEIGRPVLLMDADTHDPRLHKIFDVGNSWGLSDLLREHTPVSEYPKEAIARPTSVPNLFLLPSGTGTVVTSNLLYSPRMVELIERLREDYQHILIDTPPILQFSDARIVGRAADGVVLVFRAEKTLAETALAARQRFVEDGTSVLGCILNDWNPKRTPGYSRSYVQ